MRKKAIVIIILICTFVMALIGIVFIVKNIRTVEPEEEKTPTTTEVISIDNGNSVENENSETNISETIDDIGIEITSTEETDEHELHSGSGVVVDNLPHDSKWFTKVLFLVDRNYNNTENIQDDSILTTIEKIEVYNPRGGDTDIYIIFNNGNIDNIIMSQFDTNSDTTYLYLKNISSSKKNKVTKELTPTVIEKEYIEQYVNAMQNNYYISDYTLGDSMDNVIVDKMQRENHYLTMLLSMPPQQNLPDGLNILDNPTWLNGIRELTEEQGISIKEISKIEIYYNEISKVAVFRCYLNNDNYILIFNTYYTDKIGEYGAVDVKYNLLNNENIDTVEQNTILLGEVEHPYSYIDEHNFISINDILKGE